MAECHPVGFQWVMEARRRGAKVIHVDPRFTRTSAVADLHVPIRVGTDVAWLGGLINHVLQTGSEFREYVVQVFDPRDAFSSNEETYRRYLVTNAQYSYFTTRQLPAPAIAEYMSEPVPAITRAAKVEALNSCSA